MNKARWVWLISGGVLLLGCLALVLWFRGLEPTVTGTVRLDGKLLERGSVTLVPVDGTAGPGGGSGINKNGEYEIKQGLQAGRYRVEIRSTITLPGRKVPSPPMPSLFVDEEVPVVPEEYNSKSTLIRDVHPGANVLNFELEAAAHR